MTVGELIERLRELPADRLVVVASTDREDPSAYPLTRADIERYRPMVGGGVILEADEVEPRHDAPAIALYSD